MKWPSLNNFWKTVCNQIYLLFHWARSRLDLLLKWNKINLKNNWIEKLRWHWKIVESKTMVLNRSHFRLKCKWKACFQFSVQLKKSTVLVWHFIYFVLLDTFNFLFTENLFCLLANATKKSFCIIWFLDIHIRSLLLHLKPQNIGKAKNKCYHDISTSIVHDFNFDT